MVVPASSIGAVYGRVPSKRETKVGARCLLSSEATSQKGADHTSGGGAPDIQWSGACSCSVVGFG